VNSDTVTMHTASEMLCIGEPNVRKLVADGEITAVKVGRTLRIDEESIDNYIERQIGGITYEAST
jgi:excisionase family DNA binding protein